MITNERQYRITKARAERFERSVAEIDGETEQFDPLLRKAMGESLESLLHDLRHELRDYEELRAGRIDLIEVESLASLPEALVRARIASGATQKELARRLGLKEQQIQRYEANRYDGASLRRLQQVADALGVQSRGCLVLPKREVHDGDSSRGASPAQMPAGSGDQ